MNQELVCLISDANLALGRLDGIATILSNLDLFVPMYVCHEAMLSYQIARAQSSLGDVLHFEIDADGKKLPNDVEDVVNHVNVMNHGLSLGLIWEIHERLHTFRMPLN